MLIDTIRPMIDRNGHSKFGIITVLAECGIDIRGTIQKYCDEHGLDFVLEGASVVFMEKIGALEAQKEQEE